MPNPYHVRLAISQYGDRFRTELFTEDLGDTDGELLPADWRDSFTRWMDYLQGGGKPAPESDADIGGQLFDWLFGGVANRTKWTDVLGRAEREGNRPVRLLIDSSTLAGPAADPDADRIHNLPYGLLFERQRDTFVFRPQPGKPPVQYVRIVRRCTPRLLNLERAHWPLRVLLAVAEPEGLAFGGAREVTRLAVALSADPGAMTIFVCTPGGPRRLGEALAGPAEGWTAESLNRLCRTTPEQLRAALAAQRYDLLHLVAHGSAGGLVLCDSSGRRVEVRARELCEWCKVACSCSPACVGPCRLNPRIQMAFLQVCRAAGTHAQGSFGGLAQKLINPDGGDLAAVIASPYVLEADQSTTAALEFYGRLTRGEPPDQALVRNLAMANWAWAFLELWVRPSALSDTGARGAFQFVSPYRGLGSFKERDADVFFGREAEVEDYRSALVNDPVLVIAGDSGSGKSSVLYAGLAHRVRGDGLAGVGGWRIVTVRPGREPARNLMAALLLQEEPGGLEVPAPGDWAQPLAALLAMSCGADQHLLLIVDQFEEMFTLCAEPGQREAVARALAEMAGRAGGHFRLVVGIRNDYLGPAVTLPGLGEWLQRPRILRPPTAEAIRAIVARPAEASGYRFEGPLNDAEKRHGQDLLERILADPLVRGEGATEQKAAAPLPLLEFALEQLWLRAVERGSQEFTHADYDKLGGGEGDQQGGLGGAIAQHADEVYRGLPETFPGLGQEAQKLAEELFTSLVSPTHRTRTPCRRKEIEERSGRAESMRAMIDHLVGERLLTIRSDPDDLKETQVDLAHEVLIKRWGQLRAWLDHDRGEQVRKEEFRKDAARWDRGSDTIPARSWKGLPGTETQTEYLNWIKKRHPALTDAERAFAEGMYSARRWRKWRQRAVAVVSLTVAALMAGLAWYANSGWNSAQKSEKKANDAKNNALQAQSAAVQAQQTAVSAEKKARWRAYRLGMELVQQAWARGDASAMLRALRSLKPHLGEEDYRSFDWYYFWQLLHRSAASLPGHPGKVTQLAFAPGGAVLTVAGGEERRDGRKIRWAELWEVGAWRKRPSLGAVAGVASLVLSPDGKWWAGESADGVVKVGEVQTGALRFNRAAAKGGRCSLFFSGSGKTLAIAGKDEVELWDVVTGERSGSLPEGQVRDLIFSGKDETLFTITGLALKQWALSAGRPAGAPTVIEQRRPHGDRAVLGFRSLRLTQDGHTLVVENRLNNRIIVQFRDVRKAAIVESVGGDTGDGCLALSPTGNRLAMGFLDGSVKVWEVPTGRLLASFHGHVGPVYGLAFSPDRRTLASGGEDTTVRLWEVDSTDLLGAFKGHLSPIASVAFSPDGRRVVSGGVDGTVNVWDVNQVKDYESIPTGAAWLNSVGFSPDGKVLFYAVSNGFSFVDPTTRAAVTDLPSLAFSNVVAVAFSPDAETLAIVRPDKVRLWDRRLKREAAVLPGAVAKSGARSFTGVTFSPDGGTLASTGDDRLVRLWDAATGRLLATLPGETEPSALLAFSPDGRVLFAQGQRRFDAWDVVARRQRTVTREEALAAFSRARRPRTGVSADGRCVLDVRANGTGSTIKLVDWVTGEERAVLRDLPPYADDTTFSPDGSILVSSFRGTAQLFLWRAASAQDVAAQEARLGSAED